MLIHVFQQNIHTSSRTDTDTPVIIITVLL